MRPHPFQFLLKINLSLRPLFIFFLNSILWIQCRPSESVEFLQYRTNTKFELTNLHWFNDTVGVAVGGNTWYNSVAIHTPDKGLTWTTEELFGRGIFSLDSDKEGNLYGCGLDKKVILIGRDSSTTFKLGDYIFFRAIDAFNTRNILIAGGEGLAKGFVYQTNLETLELKPVMTLARELSLVHCIDSLQWLVAGFGIVMKSRDGSKTWDTLDVAGDHWIDKCFLDDQVGYLCGSNGSIIKTRDGGEHWSIVRDASKITVSDQPFRCIQFISEQIGIIAGENGLIWKTTDGGDHWTELTDLPMENYLDVKWHNHQVWLCGSNGIVISFSID